MLANFRESWVLKVFQYFFALICLSMVVSPLIAAFYSTESNPVVLQNSIRHITLKDLLNRDRALLQTLQDIPAQNSEMTQFAVKQYYRSVSYKDFFETYRCSLSDSATWNSFVKQLGPSINAEQYAALEQTIQKHFGSKKNFFSEMKVQILAQNMQDKIMKIVTPIASKNTVLSAPLQYTIQQYNFSPSSYISQVQPVSMDVLKAYYAQHAPTYSASAMVNVQAIWMQPSLLDLSTVDPLLVEQARADLSVLGYADEAIDDRLLQKQVFDHLVDTMQTHTLRALSDFKQLYSESLIAQTLALDRITASQMDEMFSSPGLFESLDSHFGDRTDTPPLIFLAQEEGLWVLEPANYQEARVLPYDEVSSQVLQDWTDESAGLLAQQAAAQYVQNYKERLVLTEKPAAEYITTHIFQDERFSNAVKVQLSHLIAANLNRDRSIVQSFDGQRDSGVKVFVLDSLSFAEPIDQMPETALQEQAAADPMQFAYQSAMLQAFDHSMDLSFGYQIQPELWTLLDRVHKHNEETWA